VGRPSGHPGKKGQDGRGAVQGLDLGFLSHAEHHRRIRRVAIEAHDVSHLIDRLGIRGELEALDLVGFEPEGPPYTRDRGLAHARLAGQGAGGPVGGVLGGFFQSLCDHPFHIPVGDASRSSRPRLINKTVQAQLGKAPAPLAHGGPGQGDLGCDLPVGTPVGGGKHDTAPLGESLGALGPAGPAFEGLPLLRGKQYVRCRSADSSMAPPSSHLEAKFAIKTFLPLLATQDTRLHVRKSSTGRAVHVVFVACREHGGSTAVEHDPVPIMSCVWQTFRNLN